MEATQLHYFLKQKGGRLMGVGFALFAVALILDEPGMIIGWLLGWLGVAGLVFRLLNWRRQPGVWMLALVFLALGGLSCAVFESAGMPHLLHGPFPRNLLALLDYLGGFVLLFFHGRLALAVARHNWNLTGHADSYLASR